MRIGSLFTGYGGLDMAAETFYGATTAWTCDNDPGASKILAHRMPDVPNLGDITMIDWDNVEPVDILAAGWPCQPFSLAGKRKGAEDERALWPEVVRAVRALRPRHVVLENVAAIATAGELARAVADLATLGYVGSWRCLRAADIGAPHLRARIFILATDPSGVRPQAGSESGRARQDRRTDALGRRGGDTAADAARNGWDERRPESTRQLRGSDAAQRSAVATADTERSRRDGYIHAAHLCEGQPDIAWGAYEPAIRRWERILRRLAPPPTEAGPKGAQRLSPRFEEWMMGLPDGWVTDVPGLARNPQMKALGNGVVPQQALAALTMMEQQ